MHIKYLGGSWRTGTQGCRILFFPADLNFWSACCLLWKHFKKSFWTKMHWPYFSPTGLSQQHDFLLCGQNSVLMPHKARSSTSGQIMGSGGHSKGGRGDARTPSFLGPSTHTLGWAQQGSDHKQLPFATSSKSTKYFSHTIPTGSSQQVYDVYSNSPILQHRRLKLNGMKWLPLHYTRLESGKSNVKICAFPTFWGWGKGRGGAEAHGFPFLELADPFRSQFGLKSHLNPLCYISNAFSTASNQLTQGCANIC